MHRSLRVAFWTLAIIPVVAYAVLSYSISSRNLQGLEVADLQSSVTTTEAATAYLQSSLSKLVNDYARWTETWENVREPNEAWIVTNLIPWVPDTYHVDTVLLTDLEGRVIASYQSDFLTSNPELLRVLIQTTLKGTALSGNIRNGRGLQMISAQVVTDNDGNKPNGMLLLGQKVDASLLAQVKRLTDLEVAINLAGESSVATEGQWIEAAQQAKWAEKVTLRDGRILSFDRESPSWAVVRVDLLDVLGKPLGNMVLGQRRDAVLAATSGTLWGGFFVLMATVIGSALVGNAFARHYGKLTLALQQRETENARLVGELQQLNVNLETKVHERTQELEETVHTLQSTRERLTQSERLSTLGETVAGVAHELNNPLTSVIGYVQLAQDQVDDADVIQDLKRAGEQADRCVKIVRDLLTFARQQRGRESLVDINSLVQNTVGLRHYVCKTENIVLDTDLAPGLPPTVADASQVQQILLNLLINAEQALMGKLDGPRRVCVTTSQVAESAPEGSPPRSVIRIVVEDNGPGVPEEVRNHVFEPFFTTKEIGQGTGLGLSISYGIITSHGGNIWLESPNSGGARFVVDLPVRQDLPAESTASASSENRKAGPGDARLCPLNILIVDDEKALTDVLCRALSADGHRVTIVNHGTQALSEICDSQYDVVLLDLRMPGHTGQEIFEHCATRNPDLLKRIVLMTGDTARRESWSFLQASGRPYLVKPFTAAALANLLKEIVKGTKEQ